MRKVWEVVNEIICQKRKKVAIPKEIINMRGETVANESRADAFDQFFINQSFLTKFQTFPNKNILQQQQISEQVDL